MSASIEKKLDRILFHIESDPSTGHIGMAEQTQINTKDINNIKTRSKVAVGVAVVLGFLGGNILNILKLFKLIL
jgi:hypothetical protein